MQNDRPDTISQAEARAYASALKSFYSSIVQFVVRSFRKYWYLLLLGVLAGAGMAYMKHRKSVPYYEGQASFTYVELHKRIYGEMIDKLRGLAHSGSYKTLASQLQISEQQAMSVMDMEAVNVAGSPLSEDMTKDKLPFYIRVKLRDRSMADTLLTALENYLNNNKQARIIASSTLKQMNDKIAYYKSQLQKLDSMKRLYQFYMAEQNIRTGAAVNTFNPIDLFTESEKLFNTTSDLESAVKSYKAVKILDGFVINDYPVMPSYSGLALKYIAWALLAAAVLSLLLHALKAL